MVHIFIKEYRKVGNRTEEKNDRYGVHDKDKQVLAFSDEPISNPFGMIKRVVEAGETGKRKIPVIPIIAVGCILLILWITGGDFANLTPIVLTAAIMILVIGTVSCLILYTHSRRKKETEEIMKSIEAEHQSGHSGQ